MRSVFLAEGSVNGGESKCRFPKILKPGAVRLGWVGVSSIAVDKIISECAAPYSKLLHKNPGTVSWWLAAVDRRSREGVACRRHLDDLDRAISTLASPKVTK